MAQNLIVAAVDASAEAARAAQWASSFAGQTGAALRLIHALKSEWIDPTQPLPPTSVMERVYFDMGVRKIRQSLGRTVADDVLTTLEVRPGRPSWVIERFAHEVDAGLVVLGGKHHSVLQRWLGGSTAHHIARRIDIPLLVTGEHPGPMRRLLVAVDLSRAAVPTVLWATQLAERLGAVVRVLHTVEPPPAIPEVPVTLQIPDLEAEAQKYLEAKVWPHIGGAVERTVQSGPARVVVADEVTDWEADLLVVGSHGRGWVDRLLLGSFTEWLLNNLPTSVAVVPVPAPD